MPEIPAAHGERLRSLAVALDPERMRDVLAPVARGRLGPDVAVERIDIAVFRRHVNRYVLRYTVLARDGAARERRLTMIGKILDRGAGERLDAHMRRLWEHGFARAAADGIAIPEPFAYLPELGLALQEEVGGASVRNLLKEAPDPEHFRLAGRALAKLHACGVALGPMRGVAEHLERCHPRHPELARVCAAWSADVERIVRGARAIEQELGAIPRVTVHGDFHLGQVHVAPGRAWLVDLDALGTADPASDLGNLLVFLEDKARRHAQVEPLIRVFLDAYGADGAVLDRVPLYQALTHLRRACKALRLANPGWRERVTRMLAHGVAAIDAMERRVA